MLLRRLFLLSIVFSAVASLLTAAEPVAGDEVITLPPFGVSETGDEGYDPTGLGAVDEEMRDAVFSNELTSIDFAADPGLGEDMEIELDAIENDSPAERALGQSRLRLRGFPTPSMRNSFLRVGLPPVANVDRVVVVEGPLVPVLGRAAPGGIQNYLTARPRAKAQGRIEFSASNRGRLRAKAQVTGPLVPKRYWERVAVEWQRRDGPEQFARSDVRTASAAVTWRHSRAASTLIGVDFTRLLAHVPPGIPAYRRTAGAKIAGPYLPLALFNSNGPDAAVRRDTGVVTVQSERQLSRPLAMRASVEAWWGDTLQDRFTSPVLLLDRGVFEGVREPRHVEQRQRAVTAQLEMTARFRLGKTEHKLMAAAAQTWGTQTREERALPAAARAALPDDVRTFDPWAPNYYAPAYDPLLFARLITDRAETARYTAAELGDRMAWRGGLVVVTAGVHYDAVTLGVTDRRPNTSRPRFDAEASRLSFHSGLNWQIRRNRLLAFATASSGFDPATRVDARTGRIQPHESTLGYELGLRGRVGRRFEYSTAGFLLHDDDVAQRNPLYDDPGADPNQTQPQLVAPGRERYTGVRLDARWRFDAQWQVVVRGVEMEARTTHSPDLPAAVGRPVARVPERTGSIGLRRRPERGHSGWTASVATFYVGGYVANYEDARRAELAYPGYGLVNAAAGYVWRRDDRTIEGSVGVRNVLDRDLLASNARVAAGRELTCSVRMVF